MGVDGLFGPEHEAFRQTVRSFVEREIRPHVDRWEREGGFPRALFPQAAAVGVLGAGYPEALGGAGGDLGHMVVAMEELVCSGSPGLAAGLLAHGIALPPLLRHGTADQQERLVRPVLEGQRVAALAVTEPGAGSDVANLETRAVREGEHYVVTGRKVFITNGVEADQVTALVRTGGPGAGGLSVLVIERDAPGYAVTRKLEKLGWRASDTAELAFDGCRVPAENLVGAEGAGFAQVMENFAGERLFLAIAAVAIAELAFQEARRFVAERRAFGRPIEAFQVTRHKLAEMRTAIEVTRTYCYHVAARVRDGAMAVTEAAMAKNAASDMACRVVDQALQLHGGYGFTQEYLVERLYRDVRLYPIGGGTREIMNELIARTL